ncbi:hypothetical protein ABK040_015613 [Willaertia magna]
MPREDYNYKRRNDDGKQRDNYKQGRDYRDSGNRSSSSRYEPYPSHNSNRRDNYHKSDYLEEKDNRRNYRRDDREYKDDRYKDRYNNDRYNDSYRNVDKNNYRREDNNKRVDSELYSTRERDTSKYGKATTNKQEENNNTAKQENKSTTTTSNNNPSETTEEVDENVLLMQQLGLPVSFDTTHGKHVKGKANNLYGVKIIHQRKVRQVMNLKDKPTHNNAPRPPTSI